MLPRLLALFLLAVSAFAAEIPLSPPHAVGAGSAQWPQIASDGTNFLVTWTDGRLGSPAIWASRVGADGRRLDAPTGIRLSSASGAASDSAVALWTGSWYFVGFHDRAGFRVVRIDGDGHVLDSTVRPVVPGTLAQGAAAAAGDRVLIAANGLDITRVTAWLLDARGALVEVTTLNAGVPRGTIDNAGAAASNGSSFLLTWRHLEGAGRSVAIAAVSRDGKVGAIRYVSAKSAPALAANGSDYLVAYFDAGGTLVAEHVDAQGALVARHALPYTAEFPSDDISVGPYGSGYAVVGPATAAKISPTFRVDGDGRLVGPLSVMTYDVARPRVAFASNGDETMAAWAEFRVDTNVYARVVGVQRDETLLSRAAPVQRGATLATDGDGYLAAWLELKPGRLSPQVRVGRFTAAGLPRDGDGFTVGEASALFDSVGVAFDGANYVVAWLTPPPWHAAYARVAPDGRLLDPTPRVVDALASFGGVALASNGVESLLAFPRLGAGVDAVLIGRDGSQRGFPERVSWDAERNTRPSVAWNGSLWLVAWQREQPFSDPTLPPPPPGLPPPGQFTDVHAARLTPAVQLLDPVPLAISTNRSGDAHPAAASNGRDFVVAWSEWTPEGPSSVVRPIVRARRVGANGVLSGPVEFGSGSAPSITALGDDYIVAWIRGGGFLFAPLSDSSARLVLALGADAFSRIALLGHIAAYDRVAMEPEYGGVPRGFLKPLQDATRKRPSAR